MNKKKICIIISSIFIFIIIICVALYLYSKNSQKLESSKSLESEEIQNEIIENTTDVEIPEVQEEKSISNEDENQKEINTSIVQEDSKNVAEASSKTSSKKTNTKSIESKAKNTQTETKKTETPKQVENTTTTTTIIETPKKEEIKEDPKPSQSTPSTNTEKYVKNDAMINKIKNVIQNNESDFMKQYGYNIVVDSSIKAQTNQFTYTENRVKSYITYKFGTIRIYAEDYYVNGNLIMTECYIL